MKRWTLRIFLFLLLGAILNVAVAWGLAISVKLTDVDPTYSSVGTDGVFVVGIRGWVHPHGHQLMSVCVRSESGPSHGEAAPLPAWSPLTPQPSEWMVQTSPRAQEIEFAEARGWPSLALLSSYRIRSSNAGRNRFEQVRGIHVADWSNSPYVGAGRRMIPTEPIWPGFAINTLFYAVIVCLLFAATSRVRRWRRIRHGLCPKCAYDLRGTPRGEATACPECGATR